MALPPGFGRDGSEEIDAVTGHLEFLGGLEISDERKARLTESTVRGGWEWWNLSPAVQRSNTRSDDSGRDIVAGMLACVGMRRSIDTVL
jgi:hypothetical protein